MRKFKLGNKGLSLLELLVGITMLAIIVVPVLHAMLTSSTTSNKAKELRNQTVAAQNILESYEATDINAIVDQLRRGDTALGKSADIIGLAQLVTAPDNYDAVTDYAVAQKDGPGYKLYLNNVVSGGKTYDAVLTLDASAYGSRNSVGIVDYKPMDTVIPRAEPGDASNPDVMAAKDIASQAQIDSGIDMSYSYFLDKMTRTITIDIHRIENTNTIIYAVNFHYQASYDYTLEDEEYQRDYTSTIPIDVPNGEYTENFGLYFFFNPNVPVLAARTPGVPYDTIEIVNSGNIAMSIYLVRQSSDSASYAPTIKLMEKATETNTPNAMMYYNNETQMYDYLIGYGTGELRYIWHQRIKFDGSLIGTPPHNRLYGVTVQLFKAGTIAGGDLSTPLAEFDASSLE